MTTKEQVIELAREAGLEPRLNGEYFLGSVSDIQNFAKLVRNAYQAELLAGRKGPVCRLWVEPETCNYIVDRCDHPPSETIDVYTADQLAAAVLAARNAALDEAAQKCEAIEEEYHKRESMKYPELKSDAETGACECAAAIESLKEPTP